MTDRIEPLHLFELSDHDVVELLDALAHVKHDLGHYITGEHGTRLVARLQALPDYYEDEQPPPGEILSEQGKRALAETVVRKLLLTTDNPHCDALKDALRELRIAEARFTLSIEEGRPGWERNEAIERRRFAQERVDAIALQYGEASRGAR